jgi:hypothetical protein
MMRISILISILLVVGLASVSGATTTTIGLDELASTMIARQGENLATTTIDLPQNLGTVSDVMIQCRGVYLPGETRDSLDNSHQWQAELLFFMDLGGDSYWATVPLTEGSFNSEGTFESPSNGTHVSWSALSGETVTVEAVLLASDDEYFTIVRYPGLTLISVQLVLHSSVANEMASWGQVKSLFR